MKYPTVAIFFVALSIAIIPAAVKAQNASPPQASARHESDLKDSVKSGESDFPKLVRALLASGREVEIRDGFAQVIGLDQPAHSKLAAEPFGAEARKCSVVYAADDTGNDRAIYLYVMREKKTKHDILGRYFRVSLDGKLEKAVTLRNKLDENGKAIAEGRSKFDEDIDSPEIRKIFKTDMAFWVKDWLKKQQKLMAKADAARAKNDKEASPAASPQSEQ